MLFLHQYNLYLFQIESFRKRLKAVTKDKHDASMNAMKLTEEIERKTKQLSEQTSKSKQLQVAIGRLDATAQTQLHAVASQSEAAIDTAQQQLQKVNAQNQEFQKFVKVKIDFFRIIPNLILQIQIT